MRIGSCFAGVGGLELGLEWAGAGRTEWQCEINPRAREVLAKHWPDAQRFDDMATLQPPPCELLCGGFPCQNISPANNHTQTGLGGPKSGLWSHMRRCVDAARPRYVVAENNGQRWRAWVPTVRSDLYRLGYSSMSFRVPTGKLGACHRRDRVFVVAYPHRDRQPDVAFDAEMAFVRAHAGRTWGISEAQRVGVDDGLPGRVGWAPLLGNAVSPYAAMVIGRVVLSMEAQA